MKLIKLSSFILCSLTFPLGVKKVSGSEILLLSNSVVERLEGRGGTRGGLGRGGRGEAEQRWRSCF